MAGNEGWHIGNWQIPGTSSFPSTKSAGAPTPSGGTSVNFGWGPFSAHATRFGDRSTTSGGIGPFQISAPSYTRTGKWSIPLYPFSPGGGYVQAPGRLNETLNSAFGINPASESNTPSTSGMSTTPSISDWTSAYNNALLSEQGKNAAAWAEREDALQNKYSQVREAGIKADFSKLGRAVDQRLADQLYSAGYLSNVVSQRDIDNARAAATQYANLTRSGIGADEKLVKQNYEFISRQLGLSKQKIEEGRGESRQTYETNVRGIKGAGTEAGALFSSAVEDSMSDQQKTLARMLRLADNADAQSQLEYDKEFANLQRKELDIADQRRKVDLDLWNKNLELNSATDQLTIKKKSEEAQKLADDQNRLIQAQQEQALLRNFFEEVKRQQDAENWKKMIDRANAVNAATSFTNQALGIPNPSPYAASNRISGGRALAGGISTIAAAARNAVKR